MADHVCFYSSAPLEVLAIVMDYADHMNRIGMCEEVATTCLQGFAWSFGAHTHDETTYEAAALDHAMVNMNPSLSNLTQRDGKDVLNS